MITHLSVGVEYDCPPECWVEYDYLRVIRRGGTHRWTGWYGAPLNPVAPPKWLSRPGCLGPFDGRRSSWQPCMSIVS